MPSTPRSRPRRLLRGLAIRLAITALAILAVRLTLLAESVFFYFPSRAPFTTPAEYQDVTIPLPSGGHLHAWFMPAHGSTQGEPRPAILHAHGNAGNIESHESFSSFLTEQGFHVLLFDYRGFGRSSPNRLITRHDIISDTRAALAHLASRPDVIPDRIGLFGVSLGATPALAAAADNPAVRAVCTVSAFSSWPAIAADHVPILGHALIPPGSDARQLVTRLGPTPLLIIHGDNDSIVPPHHARIIADAATQAGINTQTTLISGGDHNAIIADHPSAQAAITNFFRTTLANP